MGKRAKLILLAAFLANSLSAGEVVVGVEPIPKRKVALLFTPLVIPDLISAKLAIEYRLHDKLNLVLPLEAKWMDYHAAIGMFTGGQYPGALYSPDSPMALKWNLDFAQFKMVGGVGLKYMPFSESMTNAFYVKMLFMAGAEHFFDYQNDLAKNSAVLTHALSVGYHWVLNNRFTYGFEAGEEYIFHTAPIKNLPILISGFNPFFHFNLGFTI